MHKKVAVQINRKELFEMFVSKNQGWKKVFAITKDVEY